MVIKIVVFFVSLFLVTIPAYGKDKSKNISPGQFLKNHALCACIADGLKTGEAVKFAAAAAREYLEHGSLPLEAHTEAVLLGRTFLEKEYNNIYGDNLVFVKCIEFYNSKELDRLVKKYSSKKSR